MLRHELQKFFKKHTDPGVYTFEGCIRMFRVARKSGNRKDIYGTRELPTTCTRSSSRKICI